MLKDRKLIYTSEGIPAGGIDLFVRRAALDGSFRGAFEVPDAFLVANTPLSGVRPNLGFESAVTPDGRSLFTANEGALYQDGPPGHRSPVSVRILLQPAVRLRRPTVELSDRAGRRVARARLRSTASSSSCRSTTTRFISMERSFSVGAPDTGNTIKLFKVELRGHRPARRCCSISTTSAEPRSTTSRA